MASTNSSTPLSPAEALHVHLDNSLGAALIGVLVAAILFGVTNMQTLIYFQKSPQDPMYMKYVIAFLWVLDAFHLALISHVAYFYLVSNFTNILIVTKPTWSLNVHVLVTTLSDFIVRLFYARRVWIISLKNWFLTIGALALALVVFVSGIGFGVRIFFFDSTLEYTKISWLLYTSLGSAVAADLWTTVSICFYLLRNRSGLKSTDSKINALILYIISTGMLTSLCSIGCFVSFATMPHNYIFMGFYFSLPKLYFNSVLAMLNARERLRDGPKGSSDILGTGTYRMPRFMTIMHPEGSKRRSSFGDTNGGSSETQSRVEFRTPGDRVGKNNGFLGTMEMGSVFHATVDERWISDRHALPQV